MNFVKGMVVGSLISAGVVMMCTEGMSNDKKKIIKKGKQFVRKMGII